MFRPGGQQWEIFRHGECKECSPQSGLRDRFAARQWLQQFKGNPLHIGALRQLLSREGSVSLRMDRATDDEVLDQAAQLIGFGIWHVHEPAKVQRVKDTQGLAAEGSGGKDRDEDDQDANAQARASAARSGVSDKTPELTWVEILLVDAAGAPVPGMAYEIKLPDGTIQKGKLDIIGRARHERIEPGKCEVRFPDLDGGDWKAA